MTVRDDRSDVKQTTTGFRGPLMVQSLTSAKSKFLSLGAFSYDLFNESGVCPCSCTRMALAGLIRENKQNDESLWSLPLTTNGK